MNPLLKIYKKFSVIFIGEEGDFSLQHRIFNLFCFFVCVATFFNFFINIALELYESATITLTVALIQLISFYLSRVEKRFSLSLVITGATLHAMLVINYFFNGGINGPTVLLFLAILFLMTSVVKKSNVPFWLLLNSGLIAVLLFIEYYYPQSILVGYSERKALFGDTYFTYILIVILMTASILYKRRAYEKQTRALEVKALALEKLNSEKNKLFSIISHDLRAPVGSVKQYLSFIKDHHFTEDEKAIIEEGLVKSTNEAYELLDNLLIWAKSQLGGSKPFITKMKPAKALAKTLKSVNDYAKEKNITVTVNIEDIELAADEDMLQLVIRNLLYNAIKFSEVSGHIDFRVYAKADQAIFMIKDSGIGISDENQKKIFFLDVKSNIGTKKEKGTGLGLVLCKEYTHLQNGTIWFESEQGKGSTFFVALPLS